MLVATPFHPAAASSLGYLTGSFCSYITNYHYTFKSKKQHSHTIFIFYLMVATGFMINATVVYLLTDTFKLSAWFAQVVATATSFIFNYLVSKNVIFNK